MLAIEWKSINCQRGPDYYFGLFSVNAGLFSLREKVVEALLDVFSLRSLKIHALEQRATPVCERVINPSEVFICMKDSGDFYDVL